MNYKCIKYTKANRVANVTLARPEVLNALDIDTIAELHHCFETIEEDAEVEIVVLRGEGRAFSAGGDLKKYLQTHQDVTHTATTLANGAKVFDRIANSARIYIAAVSGLCVAGGIELILPCDFVVASEEAAFSDGHMNVSLLPGGGGTQRMPRTIGIRRAKDLILTARMIKGREAADCGLVTYCVPGAELESKVAELVQSLSSRSFSARRAAKYLINQGLNGSLEAGLHLERSVVLGFETSDPDAHEGMLAFVEKRKPRFRPPG